MAVQECFKFQANVAITLSSSLLIALILFFWFDWLFIRLIIYIWLTSTLTGASIEAAEADSDCRASLAPFVKSQVLIDDTLHSGVESLGCTEQGCIEKINSLLAGSSTVYTDTVNETKRTIGGTLTDLRSRFENLMGARKSFYDNSMKPHIVSLQATLQTLPEIDAASLQTLEDFNEKMKGQREFLNSCNSAGDIIAAVNKDAEEFNVHSDMLSDSFKESCLQKSWLTKSRAELHVSSLSLSLSLGLGLACLAAAGLC